MSEKKGKIKNEMELARQQALNDTVALGHSLRTMSLGIETCAAVCVELHMLPAGRQTSLAEPDGNRCDHERV